MSGLQVPYQCLKKSGNLLIAARGSSIDLFSLEDLSLLSTWKCPIVKQTSVKDATKSIAQHSLAEKPETSAVPDTATSQSTPPAKRRIVSDEGVSEKQADAEGKLKKKANNRLDAVASGLEAPAVILLAVTKSGQHVIAVTGEDKSIRVFEITVQEDGKQYLKSVSKRGMPKRPCALVLTEDDSTIISADKFGDVYSLPLLFSASEVNSTPAVKPTPKPFTPAANDLTVHSQRNRIALENQKKYGNRAATEKSEPSFEHSLLLGHVSMLTDIAIVQVRSRSYILSADRDEHIRISRGIPQSHIIEGFCLGHTDFVSRLCIPQGRSNLLVSGGGDKELLAWDWLSGQILSRADLQTLVADIASNPEVAKDEIRVTVSNISHARLSEESGSVDIIIVTSEGVPALFTFLLTPENKLEYIQTIRLPGNALAVEANISTAESSVVVSVDNIHKPGSTTERRGDTDDTVKSLHSYRFQGRELVAASTFAVAPEDEELGSARLTNLLYSLENLRKREGDGKDLE